MLVLNEVKEAELILKDINLSLCKIRQIVNILIRYYVNNKGYSPEAAVKEVSEYLKANRAGFNENQWHNTMEAIANDAHKKPLRDIESIPITQKEIDKINELSTQQIKKVMFTYLVLAKMNYITYRHNWVNTTDSEIIRLANIYHNFDNFLCILNDLYTLKYITPAKSMLKTSVAVEILDLEGDPVFEVTNITNLGMWWEKANGAFYRVCVDCGVIFKPNSNNHYHCHKHVKSRVCVCEVCGRAFEIPEGKIKRKRCECCQREIRLEQKRRNMREARAKKKAENP